MMIRIAVFIFAALMALPVFGHGQESVSYPWPSTSPTPVTNEWVEKVEAQIPLVERDLELLEKGTIQLRDEEMDMDIDDWKGQFVSVLVGRPQTKVLKRKAEALLSKTRAFGERVLQHMVRTLDQREIREVPFFLRRGLAKLQWRYRDLCVEIFRLQRKCQKMLE